MDKFLSAIETAQQSSVSLKSDNPEIKASSLDALSKAFDREEIVVTFPNPSGGNEVQMIFRPLEPAEQFEVMGSLLSENAAAVLEQNPNANINVDFGQLQREQYEMGLEIIQRCMIDPPNITLEILRKWHVVYINRILDDLIAGSRRNTPAARFPEDDNSAGE